MRLLIVCTDTYDFVSFFQQQTMIIPEVAGLGRASRGIILRIKIKDQFMSFEIFQPDRISILVDSIEIGCLISNF